MSIFRNVVLLAAAAGLLAGLVMAALQITLTAPLILKAEIFETNAAQNAAGSAATVKSAKPAGEEHADDNHAHNKEAWQPADGVERMAYTALANVVTAVGFALLLIVASELAGGLSGWRNGLIWGLAGFAVFTLAPGLGLPPELPAMPAADLMSRQTWWTATVLATAGGLALMVFQRHWALAVLGVGLIVAPHIIGAPQPADHASPIPADLHREFVVISTVTALLFWIVLGAAAGALRNRMMENDDVPRSAVSA